jgi:hypothetical protein
MIKEECDNLSSTIRRYPLPKSQITFNEPRVLIDFEFDPSEEELRKILKWKSTTIVSESSAQLVKKMELFSVPLIHPRAVYQFSKVPDAFQEIFSEALFLVIGVVTIGGELEKEVAYLSEQGNVAEAFILDAWGSAWVEGAIMALDKTISFDAKHLNLQQGKRMSPGYGRWHIEAQRNIFRILAADQIGVILTENAFMIPRKSISFAIPLFE